MKKICFATNNENKVKEVWPLLQPDFLLLSLSEIGCHEELAETNKTLEGNSLQKASYVFNNYHIPCFADDTGLEVEALHGAPGVYSARYAGPQRNSHDNIELLLKNMEGITNRKACFRTVITLVGIEAEPIFFEGRVDGIIETNTRGVDGFGYDPVFIPENHSRTFAEMTLAEKNMLSHRARAVKKLVEYLRRRERK
ncbi:MAG TPA: RdgB/HAM1 family non-canonical purine NTP pyrophosphatase [Ohtaekwangia sp.]|nr:RdgB/HAM1 family non-canonical purine NTP pyrophosphatase [Ohtaekwangia sp.]